jgi:hypothetical protein
VGSTSGSREFRLLEPSSASVCTGRGHLWSQIREVGPPAPVLNRENMISTLGLRSPFARLGSTPETLSEDGSGAGDRHLKFHDYWDNLVRRQIRTLRVLNCHPAEGAAAL